MSSAGFSGLKLHQSFRCGLMLFGARKKDLHPQVLI